LSKNGSSGNLVAGIEILVFQRHLRFHHEVPLSPSAFALTSALRPVVEG